MASSQSILVASKYSFCCCGRHVLLQPGATGPVQHGAARSHKQRGGMTAAGRGAVGADVTASWHSCNVPSLQKNEISFRQTKMQNNKMIKDIIYRGKLVKICKLIKTFDKVHVKNWTREIYRISPTSLISFKFQLDAVLTTRPYPRASPRAGK